MRKDEEVLKDKLIPTHGKNVVKEHDVLSAMEQQAVHFAEWLQQHCIYTDNGFYYYAFTNRQYNLTDLYTLFNTPTNGNKQNT
jgi:hypothetical protein